MEDRPSAIGEVMGPKYKGSLGVTNCRLLCNRGPDIEINTRVTLPKVHPSIISTILAVFSYVIVFLACAWFLGRKAYDNWSDDPGGCIRVMESAIGALRLHLNQRQNFVHAHNHCQRSVVTVVTSEMCSPWSFRPLK